MTQVTKAVWEEQMMGVLSGEAHDEEEAKEVEGRPKRQQRFEGPSESGASGWGPRPELDSLPKR